MKGTCPRCGAIYYGWALANQIEQKCGRCGDTLEIRRGDAPAWPGLSSLKAEAYLVVLDRDRWENDLTMNMRYYFGRN